MRSYHSYYLGYLYRHNHGDNSKPDKLSDSEPVRGTDRKPKCEPECFAIYIAISISFGGSKHKSVGVAFTFTIVRAVGKPVEQPVEQPVC